MSTDYDEFIGPIEDRMIRTIWRITRHAQDAEDAMQDALTTIWKRWRRVRTHPNPHALVLRICINSAYDVVRQRLRETERRDVQAIEDVANPMGSTPAECVSHKERHAEVVKAISKLSEHQAVATTMRVLEEQPYSSIAAALGCSEVTARKHVLRGRRRLSLTLRQLLPSI